MLEKNVFSIVQLVHCIEKLLTKYKNQGNRHRGDSGKGEPGESLKKNYINIFYLRKLGKAKTDET